MKFLSSKTSQPSVDQPHCLAIHLSAVHLDMDGTFSRNERSTYFLYNHLLAVVDVGEDED